MKMIPPLSPRSLLFVPADNDRLLEKAHQRGADALILDLEDGVLPAAKPAARQGLARHIARLQPCGIPLLVRINASWRACVADLEAAIFPGVTALMVPKVEGAGRLEAIAAMVCEWEAERGIAPGTLGLVALIENPVGLEKVVDIAKAPRLTALALGGEDFSHSLGVTPSAAALSLPCQQIALTAAAHGLAALGLPGDLTEFKALESYQTTAQLGRAFGMTGALCIHPAQAPILNQVFSPSPQEVAWADRAMAAWRAAQTQGQGAIALDGRMIDRPVAERAQAILARAASLNLNPR